MLLRISGVTDGVHGPDLEHVLSICQVSVDGGRLAGRPLFARRQPTFRRGAFLARSERDRCIRPCDDRRRTVETDRRRDLVDGKRGDGRELQGSTDAPGEEAVLAVGDDAQVDRLGRFAARPPVLLLGNPRVREVIRPRDDRALPGLRAGRSRRERQRVGHVSLSDRVERSGRDVRTAGIGRHHDGLGVDGRLVPDGVRGPRVEIRLARHEPAERDAARSTREPLVLFDGSGHNLACVQE